MHIKRIQVEEGFLDGLDLTLPPGLVTFIGARGTGKTSVIELIRFCLGVGGHTAETTSVSREHALSILESGQVTLTLQDGTKEITISRSATDDSPRITDIFTAPIIFSQTEIENIGLQSPGRLRIVDGFLNGREITKREEDAAISETRSLTAEMSKLRKEIEDIEMQRGELPSIEAQLAALKPSEDQLATMSDGMKQKTDALAAVSAELTSKEIGAKAVSTFMEAIVSMKNNLVAAAGYQHRLDPWPLAATDLIAPQREQLLLIEKNIQSSIAGLDAVYESTSALAAQTQKSKLPLEENARVLRREIDQLKEGSGAIVRQAQLLRTKKAQLDALKPMIDSRRERLANITAQREKALEKLETARQIRSKMREEVINDLNGEVGPRIRLVLERSAQYDRFATAITDALKGSGLKYNELALTLAREMSPRELMECVEKSDIEFIVRAVATSKDRALRIVSSLKEVDLGLLSTTLVDDDVAFQLLDGKDYKDIGDLSTGQRCTVILPIVLQHKNRLLIVDQPEDHIDNAFIADTLITAINSRSKDGQIIFTTHNANIPVLGESECVVEMGSDGRRGFVKSCASLNEQVTVDAITGVMEGGAAAFKARAKFYHLSAS